PGAARALADDHVRRRPAQRPADRPDGGGRRPDGGPVRRLRPEGAGPRAAGGRRGGDGQPVLPQAGGGGPGDRGGRGPGGVPAAVLAGPQPHRERVQQAQGPAAVGRRADRGGAVGALGPVARRVRPAGVPELPPALWVQRYTRAKTRLAFRLATATFPSGDTAR